MATLVLILPFFALIWYSRPLFQEFEIAHQLNDNPALVDFLSFRFQEESSRYLSNILFYYTNPLAFDRYYLNYFVPFSLATGLVLVLMFLANRLMGPAQEPVYPFIFGWLAAAIYINELPDIASAFFNGAQAVSFHVPLVTMFFLVAIKLTLFKYHVRNPVLNLFRFTIAVVLIFLLCGSNEHFAILLMFVLGLTVLGRLFLFFRLDGQLLLYLISGCLGMVLLLLSPITFDKMQTTESFPYTWDVIWLAGKSAFYQNAVWCASPGMVLLMAVSFQAGLKANFPGGLGKLNPVWLLIGMLLITWLAALPYYFGPNLQSWEVVNTRFFLVFLGVVLFFFQIGFKYKKGFKIEGNPPWAMAAILVLLASFGIHALKSGNLGRSYQNWMNGSAKSFQQVWDESQTSSGTGGTVQFAVPSSFVPNLPSHEATMIMEQNLGRHLNKKVSVKISASE